MKIFCLFITLLFSIQLSAQQTYWQQHLRYYIKADLNEKEKSITGFETIVYKNNSPSTLNFIRTIFILIKKEGKFN